MVAVAGWLVRGASQHVPARWRGLPVSRQGNDYACGLHCIITAARHDRTSFGCADENDFTYFGRAFFKEALPKSDSFFDAFNKAQGLVSEWEKKDRTPEAERSLPQIHSPVRLSEQLKKWWAQPRR